MTKVTECHLCWVPHECDCEYCEEAGYYRDGTCRLCKNTRKVEYETIGQTA